MMYTFVRAMDWLTADLIYGEPGFVLVSDNIQAYEYIGVLLQLRFKEGGANTRGRKDLHREA